MATSALKSTQQNMGTFSTPSFTTVGDPYNKKKKDVDPKLKGKPQMMTKATPGKTGMQDGYFSKSYDRIFEKEPITDQVKMRRKLEASKRKKMIGPQFRPTNASKKLASPGSYDGTFSGKVEYLKPGGTKKQKAPKEARNFLTNPGKKGSGFGYVDVTLSKPPEYKSSNYDAAKIAEKKRMNESKKLQKGPAFKATAPNDQEGNSGLFDPNPYRAPTKLPKIRSKKTAAPKKVTVPFYPTKPAKKMDSGGNKMGTFTQFTYTPEKPKKKPAAKKLDKVFKPVSNSKSMPIKSVTMTNLTRTMARSSVAL